MQNIQANGHALPPSSQSSQSSHPSLPHQDRPPHPRGGNHPAAPRIPKPLGPLGTSTTSLMQAPGYQATQSNPFLDHVRALAHSMPSLGERLGVKREREEAPEQEREQSRDPAQAAGYPLRRVPEKKAKAAVKQERKSGEPPPLALGPSAAPHESTSSTDADTKAVRTRAIVAVRAATDLPSLACLSGPAREQALAQRRAVLDAWALRLAQSERPKLFTLVDPQLVLSTPPTAQELAAFDIALLAARALVRHMTPAQLQDALRAASALPGTPSAFKFSSALQRRIHLISLYESMDAAGRDAELTAMRRDGELVDMDRASLNQVIKLRADQFAALGHLLTPAQRRAELARLREPGRLLHMDTAARAPALELLAAQFWGVLTPLTEGELREERALALTMTTGLQDMADIPWQRTLELRKTELFQNCRLTAQASVLPSLREAVVPTALQDLRGPALERGLALRKLLVRELLVRLPTQDRDRALRDARDPATLADHSGMTLEIAIRLRKLVFDEYFRTLPPRGGSVTAANVELTAALDTSGLASQPEAQALRSALLQLALVDATRQTVVPTASSSSSSSSSPSGPAQ